ncbi:SNAP25 homologous protein SNAP33-like [Rutidosis leptorrhynchoides]|uniref:SNAP25 homologous protein SNAP33-like n=1 Tax=Rutidosis leptorrhynchoides TaxID=125765 RepID=UPI003A98E2B2
MFNSKRSPLKVTKHNSVDPGYTASSHSNPFDSDDEIDNKKTTLNPSRRTSSEPQLTNLSTNPFDDGDVNGMKGTSSYSRSSAARNNYKNDFRDSGGIENQSVQELEDYAVYKSEETTKTTKACLKIALDMREDAANTLVKLHEQGEQITRTHHVAADIDHDLSRGEKLLGSLGGIFSKKWKPKKTHQITGPHVTRDSSPQRKAAHFEQREKLGLNSVPKGRSSTRTPPPEPTNAYQKVEVENWKQDDALSDVSDILGELKEMAIGMGSEIDRQNKGLDLLDADTEELNYRVRGATQRARRLLGK